MIKKTKKFCLYKICLIHNYLDFFFSSIFLPLGKMITQINPVITQSYALVRSLFLDSWNSATLRDPPKKLIFHLQKTHIFWRDR